MRNTACVVSTFARKSYVYQKLFCTETLKRDTCLQVLERSINSCPKSRTILDNSVLAALDQSGLPAFLPHPIRSLTQVLSARACGLERALAGTSDSPTTLTCLLICRRAWAR